MEFGGLEPLFSNVSCPYPFIAELSVPYSGGDLNGRWCKSVPSIAEGVVCCLPCPIESWRYSSSFNLDMVPWIGVFILVLAIILGATFALLPASATWRHYLTTSPLIGFIFLAISFILSLAPSIDQCHDAITPNDWLSDHYCAVSGFFLLYGVWVLIFSCFFRSLTLYLHLCWEVELGKKFMYFVLCCIFVGSVGLTVEALFASGVAYHTGKICSINSYRGRASFWGPLLGVSGSSLLLQLLIIAHCIHHILDPWGNPLRVFSSPFSRGRDSQDMSLPLGLHLPVQYHPRRQITSRIWNIIKLQWRAVVIVGLILFHAAFLCQALLRIGTGADYSSEQLAPWLICLATTGGNRDECLNHVSQLGASEGMIMAAWIILSLSGVWGFCCAVRWSMFPAWRDWIKAQTTTLERRIMNTSTSHSDPDRQSDRTECYTLGIEEKTIYSPVSEVFSQNSKETYRTVVRRASIVEQDFMNFFPPETQSQLQVPPAVIVRWPL